MGYHKHRIYPAVIRSSGSVGANYTEGSDDLGKTDEKMKIKNCKTGIKRKYTLARFGFDISKQRA